MSAVSIILPCFNGSRWLSEAIDSILCQEFRDFELLIINDGSTDNSETIISSYLKDKRIRYFYQKNRGFSAALNKGIEESKGEFIGFIGQDDLWLPHKLEHQVSFFRNQNQEISLVHSSFYCINSVGQIESTANTMDLASRLSKEGIIKNLFLNNFIGFETVLVDKRCFTEVGLFDEQMVAFSDHDMWLRMAGKFRFAYANLPLVKKRVHDHQLSKNSIQASMDEFLIVKKAVDLYPFLNGSLSKKLASLYYNSGIALLQQGNYGVAKKDLLNAIKWEPWNLIYIAAYINPTRYLYMLNRYKLARYKRKS